MLKPDKEVPAVGVSGRHRRISRFWRYCLIASTCLAVALAVNQLFNLGFFVGLVLLDNHYLYALIGLLLPPAFVLFPAWSGAPRDGVPWYDALLFLTVLSVVGFFFAVSGEIVDRGWEFAAPDYAVYASYVLWILALEALRRAGGMALFVVVTTVSLYPIVADIMPGPISGLATTLAEAASYHVMSNEGMLGIPMRAMGQLVIGFLIFGVALQHTGGGKFFIDLTFALLGHARGGPAKVAVFASGLMGSMSGSVISNVLTTGTMSIPAMRRTGFSPSYAAGVEACASTGGVLMPPVMGATAFVMATFLGVPYVEIALAAIIPSVLYFFGLFMQIDAHAARLGLPGLPRDELPGLRATLGQGWYFILVFLFLIFMLVYLKREVLAPFYATALLVALNQISARQRWRRRELAGFVSATGRLLTEIVAILVGVGMIVGALSVTGMVGTLVNDLVYIAGGSVLVLLLMGALTSFVLGIGMTVTAAYIFLAIVLAPALIQGGLDPMAVHLFILYWGMLSYITPPVALGAFAAAALADANPMRTGFQAMRLGGVIYFIPFFFVLDPAFILNGAWHEVVLVTAAALAGVVLLAGALQGYLIGIGALHRDPLLGWPIRAAILLGGLLLAVPASDLIPASKPAMLLAATLLAVPAVVLALWVNRRGGEG